jgi:copper chaperone CopZ
MQNASFKVTGMKCGGCETNVVGKLTALAGVESAVANFKENVVSVDFDADQIDVDELEEVIIAAGFGVDEAGSEPAVAGLAEDAAVFNGVGILGVGEGVDWFDVVDGVAFVSADGAGGVFV